LNLESFIKALGTAISNWII